MTESHPGLPALPPAQPPHPPYPPHHYGGQPPYYPPMQVAPKSPGLALLAAFFVPGLGSLMNGEVGKGIGIFVGWFVGFILAFVFIGIPIMIGFWVWGMVDGYQGAQTWNARRGILS